MDVMNLEPSSPFTTKDGSRIRALVHPASSSGRNQSLAEATLPVGAAATARYHPLAEELFLFTAATGRMRVGDQECDVAAGARYRSPGVEHKLVNTGTEELRLLCCCAPAYAHEDTVLTESEPS